MLVCSRLLIFASVNYAIIKDETSGEMKGLTKRALTENEAEGGRGTGELMLLLKEMEVGEA